MERRKALQFVGALIGGSFISTEIFLAGCKSDNGGVSATTDIDFTEYKTLLNALGQTMLPKTEKHPGFSATNASASIISILNDCYSPEDKKTIYEGLSSLKGFEEKSEAEKLTSLTELDKQYFGSQDRSPKFYGMLKEAALLSYFVDEAVMTKTMTYVKVPGKYDGEYILEPGANTTVFGFGV